MKEFSDQLKGFSRRVRIVRSWRGMAMGACAGGVGAMVWATLDWMGVAYTEWSWMGGLVAAGAVLGAVAGYLQKIPLQALSRSIDRRAHLEDRLSTASERSADHGVFDDALRADAETNLANLKPQTVYPIRPGRWHGGAVALCAAAAAIFLLGNTPLLMSEDAQKEREELQREGKKVERITRENLDTPEARQEMSEAEKRLADELRKLQRDMEKARIGKAEAMQRANEIQKQAEKLINQSSKESLQSLDNAQKALDKMQQEALREAGMPNVTPSMANMPDAQRQQAEQMAQQQAAQKQGQVDALNNQLNQLAQKLKDPNLSESERKALEKQMKELQKELGDAKKGLEEAKKQLEALKLSKEAQEVLAKIMRNPLYKELQELAAKLKSNAQAGAGENRPELTKEQREALQKELEKLLAELKDDKAMQEYLKALMEAMKKAGAACRGSSMCMGLGSLIPIPGSGGPGDHGHMLKDSGRVNHSENGGKGKGNADPSMVVGQQRPTLGEQAYVEIKAPTTVGTRSAIPYVKVLPSYKKKAESALEHQEIPKEHQKRVKEYFESLGK